MCYDYQGEKSSQETKWQNNELNICHHMAFNKLAYATISLTFSGLTVIVYGWHQYVLKQT